MKVETTRVAVPLRLRHAAGFFCSPDDLVAQLLPLIGTLLERGEPVALSVRPATERALHTALGNPAGLIVLAEPHPFTRGSGQTTAVRRARELRELTSESGHVTVVAEHDNRLDGVDGRYWTEFDAAANIALGDLPVSLLCFYPELPLHLEILDGARRNHPLLLVDGEFRHNPAHRLPREVLEATPTPAPALLGPPDVQLTYTAWQLREVRTAVANLLTGTSFTPARIEDIVLAINEIATNAVEHGTREAQLSLWLSADGLVCEVHDGGTLADPLPGLRAPRPTDPRGRGMWIARQLCDLLHVWQDRAGTHVRLHASP
ncbi:anti-sigma factor RsbA family regulatory protein [Pseudonocardia asaccharolytica]|uniref:Anti-sigma regulatory factor n=1 Tax=Pseudonocardia asaccharolytica DSM 44247 = NBRC 16224 TaxID=1123024 RepID=A0A511D7D7_9PSEU|nr:anti-sigma factor RsbA family regulatory protein [Pseudonocardia asaccharolytica]GEL20710.1 anti-sigma regulatory factor [Pseudonocardia asaccharolytica DSM 44247 = NBRC 16224]